MFKNKDHYVHTLEGVIYYAAKDYLSVTVDLILETLNDSVGTTLLL